MLLLRQSTTQTPQISVQAPVNIVTTSSGLQRHESSVESGEEVLYRGAKFDVCWPQNLCYKLYSYLLLKQNIPLKVPFSTVVYRTTFATVCHIVCFFFQLFSYTRSATTCSQRDKEMPSLPGSRGGRLPHHGLQEDLRVIGGPIPEVSHWQRYVGVLCSCCSVGAHTRGLVNTNNSVGWHSGSRMTSAMPVYTHRSTLFHLHSFFFLFP